MDIESATVAENRVTGVLARTWSRVKSSVGKVKDEVVKVGSSIRKLGQDDPRRIIHSLKVGLALSLVSLVYYVRPLYDGYGISGMWAVITVVVVFEFTVGGTLSKGINRGCATLAAGALGVGAQHLASLFGEKGEPIVLGALVFLLAAASTFTRFFPRIKARYDYGVLIFILTFSMVSVSGYRVEELIVVAHQRLSTILIGGATCIIVAICVCPVWAGEDLHKLIATNIDKLGNYLEGFGSEYFQYGDEAELSSKTDKKFLQAYKSILVSKNTEDLWANLARWEPGHGRFRFRHPWKQYLKVGALARKCAYQIEALNGYLISDVQAPLEFKKKIQEPCSKISSESGKALKMLSSSIKLMIDPSPATIHVANAKAATEELKAALKDTSLEDTGLLAIVPAATAASVLVQVVTCVEEITEAVQELSRLAHFKSTAKPTVSAEKLPSAQLLHRGAVKPVVEGNGDCVVITVRDAAEDTSPAPAPPARSTMKL